MNSPSTPARESSDKSRLLVSFGWLAVLALLAYFVIKNVPRYFVFTPQSYGAYYWAKATWLFPHVVSGVLAAVLGPLQFWPRIRRDYLPFHRIAGRVYGIAVLIGSIASVGMASKVGADEAAYALGLTCLAMAWLTTTGMAIAAVRRKNLLQHQQWMIRSYVVTFAFVSFRLADDLMSTGNIMNGHERSSMLAWACWALPLLVTEVLLQAGSIFKRRA